MSMQQFTKHWEATNNSIQQTQTSITQLQTTLKTLTTKRSALEKMKNDVIKNERKKIHEQMQALKQRDAELMGFKSEEDDANIPKNAEWI